MENKNEQAYKVYIVWQAMPGYLADNSCICRTLAEAYDVARWMKDSWLDAWWENGGRAQGNIRKDKTYYLIVDHSHRETIHIDEDYMTAKEIAESYLMEGGDLMDMGWPKAVEEEFERQAEERYKKWHTN